MKTRHRQGGIGLIEVLLAVVILSVGFLAAAQMQVRGMRFNQGAYFMSQANFMLRDMTDRMRANREGVANGNYAAFTTNASTTEPACYTSATACSAADIATADLHHWSTLLHGRADAIDFLPLLPSAGSIVARGTITRDAASNVYTIAVFWAEQIDDSPVEQTMSVRYFP